MTSGIKVTFAEIANAQTSIQQTSSSINQELEDLKSAISRLVATYTGQASEAYQAKQAQWDQAAAELNQTLHQISVAVGQANENYQSTEQMNVNRWG